MLYLQHFFLFFLDDSLYFIDVNAKETIETHKQRFPSIDDKVWIENLALTTLHYTFFCYHLNQENEYIIIKCLL